MRWIVLVRVALLAARARRLAAGRRSRCPRGTSRILQSLGRSPRSSPSTRRTKPSADGDLSYRDYRRARWYAVDLPANGELTIKADITPPGESVNEDFDLALEVLDPGFRVISKSDKEEADAGELAEGQDARRSGARPVPDPPVPQGRMDTAEFSLRLVYSVSPRPR